MPNLGLGALVALLVLLVVFVFAITDSNLTRDWLLGGFAALAVARLLP